MMHVSCELFWKSQDCENGVMRASFPRLLLFSRVLNRWWTPRTTSASASQYSTQQRDAMQGTTDSGVVEKEEETSRMRGDCGSFSSIKNSESRGG